MSYGSVSRSPGGGMSKITSTSPGKPGSSKRFSSGCSLNHTKQERVRHGPIDYRRKRRAHGGGASGATLLSAGARRIEVLRVPRRLRLSLVSLRGEILCALLFACALAVGSDRQVRRGRG